MNTPKNTKSGEIKQQVPKVGEMKTDKKTSNCCYKNEDCPICPTRTPQEQKSVSSILKNINQTVVRSRLNSDGSTTDLGIEKTGIQEAKSELAKLLTDELLRMKKSNYMSFDKKWKDRTESYNHALDEAISIIERKLSE